MSTADKVVVVLGYVCLAAYGLWLIPWAWRRSRRAKADAKAAREALAGGSVVIPESYRRQLADIAEASAQETMPGWQPFCAATADRLRKVTGLPDAALALVLADILRMVSNIEQTAPEFGLDRFDVLAGMLLGAAADLSSLERDLSAR